MSTKLGVLKLHPDDKSNPTRAQIHQLLISQLPGYITEFEKATKVRLTPAEAVAEMACHWIIDKYRQAESEAKVRAAKAEKQKSVPNETELSTEPVVEVNPTSEELAGVELDPPIAFQEEQINVSSQAAEDESPGTVSPQ